MDYWLSLFFFLNPKHKRMTMNACLPWYTEKKKTTYTTNQLAGDVSQFSVQEKMIFFFSHLPLKIKPYSIRTASQRGSLQVLPHSSPRAASSCASGCFQNSPLLAAILPAKGCRCCAFSRVKQLGAGKSSFQLCSFFPVQLPATLAFLFGTESFSCLELF